MNDEPLEALSSALIDPCRWIRLGAAAAAPYFAPLGAADLLAKRTAALAGPLPVGGRHDSGGTRSRGRRSITPRRESLA
jgi:hypothetical protein